MYSDSTLVRVVSAPITPVASVKRRFCRSCGDSLVLAFCFRMVYGANLERRGGRQNDASDKTRTPISISGAGFGGQAATFALSWACCQLPRSPLL
jgi:hypothetical protein